MTSCVDHHAVVMFLADIDSCPDPGHGHLRQLVALMVSSRRPRRRCPAERSSRRSQWAVESSQGSRRPSSVSHQAATRSQPYQEPLGSPILRMTSSDPRRGRAQDQTKAAYVSADLRQHEPGSSRVRRWTLNGKMMHCWICPWPVRAAGSGGGGNRWRSRIGFCQRPVRSPHRPALLPSAKVFKSLRRRGDSVQLVRTGARPNAGTRRGSLNDVMRAIRGPIRVRT